MSTAQQPKFKFVGASTTSLVKQDQPIKWFGNYDSHRILIKDEGPGVPDFEQCEDLLSTAMTPDQCVEGSKYYRFEKPLELWSLVYVREGMVCLESDRKVTAQDVEACLQAKSLQDLTEHFKQDLRHEPLDLFLILWRPVKSTQ